MTVAYASSSPAQKAAAVGLTVAETKRLLADQLEGRTAKGGKDLRPVERIGHTGRISFRKNKIRIRIKTFLPRGRKED